MEGWVAVSDRMQVGVERGEAGESSHRRYSAAGGGHWRLWLGRGKEPVGWWLALLGDKMGAVRGAMRSAGRRLQRYQGVLGGGHDAELGRSQHPQRCEGSSFPAIKDTVKGAIMVGGGSQRFRPW